MDNRYKATIDSSKPTHCVAVGRSRRITTANDKVMSGANDALGATTDAFPPLNKAPKNAMFPRPPKMPVTKPQNAPRGECPHPAPLFRHIKTSIGSRPA